MSSTAPPCPLCNGGRLEPTTREVAHGGIILRIESYLCSACREVVLDAGQITNLREAIRGAGLASSDEEIEDLLERVMLQPG